jgi:hypothetical protein
MLHLHALSVVTPHLLARQQVLVVLRLPLRLLMVQH